MVSPANIYLINLLDSGRVLRCVGDNGDAGVDDEDSHDDDND